MHVINKFRVKTLGLEPVRLGNKGPHLLAAHQVTVAGSSCHLSGKVQPYFIDQGSA